MKQILSLVFNYDFTWRKKILSPSKLNFYTNPCAIIASATFTKPAMFAPAT